MQHSVVAWLMVSHNKLTKQCCTTALYLVSISCD